MYLANLVDNVLVIKCDESKSPVAVCYLVVGQHCLLDFAELLEVSFNVFQAGRGRQTPHEYFAGPHHQLRVGLAGHRHLWLHQLAVQL